MLLSSECVNIIIDLDKMSAIVKSTGVIPSKIIRVDTPAN